MNPTPIKSIAFRAHHGLIPGVHAPPEVVKGEPRVIALVHLVWHGDHYDAWQDSVLMPN